MQLSIPLIGAIAVTRGLLGAGIGLLMSGRFNDRQRRSVGRTLVGIGIATTVPLVWRVIRSNRSSVARLMA